MIPQLLGRFVLTSRKPWAMERLAAKSLLVPLATIQWL